MLKELSQSLINIHGQRDSQALLDSERHIDFLDAFACNEPYLSAYYETFCKLQEIKSEIKKLSLDEAYKERQTDLLTYQINELEAAEITVGEREALTKKKNIN